MPHTERQEFFVGERDHQIAERAALVFARRAIAMPSKASSAASNAAIESICGVEHSMARMPSARAKLSPKANGAACANQPVSGWSTAARCRSAT